MPFSGYKQISNMIPSHSDTVSDGSALNTLQEWAPVNILLTQLVRDESKHECAGGMESLRDGTDA